MGDRNTRFFHTTVMVRRRRNRIESIQNSSGDWLVCEAEIRNEFVRHFKQIYRVPKFFQEETNQVFEEIQREITPISETHAQLLERDPDLEEIKWAVQALGSSKAPGPDGVTAGLIQ